MNESSCPSCGFSNPEGFVFCGQCGTKLLSDNDEDTSLGGERRLVTILFADVSGYTALSENLDAEDVRDLMNRWYEGLTSIVETEGGYVDKYIGDCIMALFGAPVAHEDDVERAVRTALAMQQWTEKYAKSLDEDIPALKVRIGVHMGEVVAGSVGSKEQSDYSVMGDAVNIASRLESSADLGTVLVSDAVYSKTHHAFQYDGPRMLTLKGKSVQVPAYTVTGEQKSPQSPRGLPGLASPFIGRIKEIQRLHSHLAGSVEGCGHVVSVVAEAGLGKSRLMREFLQGLPDKVNHWQITCQPHQQRTSYAVFRSLLPAVLHILANSKGWEHWSSYIRTVVNPEQVSSKTLNWDAEDRQRFTRNALLWSLHALSQHRPCVLTLDDFHWSDVASQDVVKQLCSEISNLSLCLVLANRPETSLQWQEIPPESTIRLNSLALEECEELLNGIFPDLIWDDDLRALVLNRSNGNPLFLEETLRSLMETETITLEGNQWHCQTGHDISIPDTLRSLLMSRIDRLTPIARRWFLVASVLRSEISIDVINEVLGDSANGQNPVPEMINANLVVATGNPNVLLFSHPLIQSVAYESLLRKDRRRYHGRVGISLEETLGEDISSQVETLAYHFNLSDDADRDVKYETLAGERALSLYDVSSAIRYFEQSLSRLPELKDNQTARLFESKIHTHLCEAYVTTGKFKDAIREGEKALETLSAESDHNCETARITRLIGMVHARQGNPHIAEPWFLKSLTILESREDEETLQEKTRTLLAQAYTFYRRAVYPEAMDAAEEGLACAIRINNIREEARAYRLQGSIFLAQGNHSSAQYALNKSLELCENSGDLAGKTSALNTLGNLFRDEGKYNQAEDHYNQAVRLWEKIGDVTQMAGGLNNLANLLMSQGKFQEAEKLYDKTLNMAEKYRDHFAKTIAHTNLGFLDLEMNNLESATEHLSHGIIESEKRGFQDIMSFLLCGSGEIDLRQKKWKTAKDTFQEALDLSRHIGQKHQEAMALRGLGKAYLAEKRFVDADEYLQKSLVLFKSLMRMQEVGRTSMDLAELHRQWGKPAAQQYLTEAKKVFEQLQAASDLEKVQIMEKKMF